MFSIFRTLACITVPLFGLMACTTGPREGPPAPVVTLSQPESESVPVRKSESAPMAAVATPVTPKPAPAKPALPKKKETKVYAYREPGTEPEQPPKPDKPAPAAEEPVRQAPSKGVTAVQPKSATAQLPNRIQPVPVQVVKDATVKPQSAASARSSTPVGAQPKQTSVATLTTPPKAVETTRSETLGAVKAATISSQAAVVRPLEKASPAPTAVARPVEKTRPMPVKAESSPPEAKRTVSTPPATRSVSAVPAVAVERQTETTSPVQSKSTPPPENPPPTTVRAPAPQVEPNVPGLAPAANSLARQAEQQRQTGDYAGAAATLERSLRIAPREAYLWNRLARVRMEQGLAAQAGQLAARSNDYAGGESTVKKDNWRIIAEAKRRSGDTTGAGEAEKRASGD